MNVIFLLLHAPLPSCSASLSPTHPRALFLCISAYQKQIEEMVRGQQEEREQFMRKQNEEREVFLQVFLRALLSLRFIWDARRQRDTPPCTH